jgi:hypothetical protein
LTLTLQANRVFELLYAALAVSELLLGLRNANPSRTHRAMQIAARSGVLGDPATGR